MDVLNNEILDSFNGVIKKRLTTPIYGTFLLSWIIFHWKFIFSLFFVSEDKIWQATGLLKNDYLSKEFFNFSDWYFYVSWIMPIILTWLIIWKFPKWISIPAFKKAEEEKTEKIIIKINEQKKIETGQIKLQEENIKKIKTVAQKTKKEKEIEKLDPTINWKEEFEQFKKHHIFYKFKQIIESLYKHNGRITLFTSGGYSRVVGPDILALAHSKELINIKNDKNSIEVIELTNKGKFFVSKYLEENPI